jgi:hypothetical protein
MVAGVSTKMSADEQAKRIGDAWESIQDERKPKFRVLKLIAEDGTESIYELGAHRPHITPEDIELTHKLWLELVPDDDGLHHNEIVSLALRRLARDIFGKQRAEVIMQIKDDRGDPDCLELDLAGIGFNAKTQRRRGAKGSDN